MSERPEEPAREVRFRLLGHPLHATLVHLPLGALVSVLVWDLAALLGAGPVFWTLAFWSLALGLAAAVPAISLRRMPDPLHVGARPAPPSDRAAVATRP